MQFSNIAIKTDPTLKPRTCKLPRRIFLSLGGDANPTVKLFAGNREARAEISRSHQSQVREVLVSPDLGEKLCLPLNLDLTLNVTTSTGTLRLGPFIGIYGFKRSSGRRIFSEQTSYFAKLTKVARKYSGIAYVVSPEGLNFDLGTATGHVLVPGQKGPSWLEIVLPLPDVFYDRGLFPKGPGKGRSMQIRRYLRATWGDKFFNPKFFDKWRTHRWINQNPDLRQYLPATVPIGNLELAARLFEYSPSLYLKPSGGSSGRGIIRARRQAGTLTVEYFRHKTFHHLEYKHFGELTQDLFKKGLLNRTYLVQQDLNLATYETKPFDVRALMQKNSAGKWVLTGMAARISGFNGITTNLHSGGTAGKIDNVLKAIFGTEQAQGIITKIEKLSFKTCAWVEEISGLKFGEIAVDIGVSKDGRPWLIELNAVPGRMIFSRIKDEALRKKSVARPIEYAFFLAGFPLTEIKEQELI